MERAPGRRGKRKSTDELEHSQQAGDVFDDFVTETKRDYVTARILSAAYFRDEQFAHDNIELISEYADYRVLGWSPYKAFPRVFGTNYQDLWMSNRVEALEHNPVYRKVFAQKFGLLKAEDMWNPRLSVYELLQIINDPFAKEPTKLAAIKELNAMYAITVIDDKGNTRPGNSFSEFYDASKGGNRIAARHPEPGSAEAEARYPSTKRDEDGA
jgi:hypothetical protein